MRCAVFSRDAIYHMALQTLAQTRPGEIILCSRDQRDALDLTATTKETKQPIATQVNGVDIFASPVILSASSPYSTIYSEDRPISD